MRSNKCVHIFAPNFARLFRSHLFIIMTLCFQSYFTYIKLAQRKFEFCKSPILSAAAAAAAAAATVGAAVYRQFDD